MLKYQNPMLFPTLDFFLFFIIVLIFNWYLKSWPLLWRFFLLAASYFFYGQWDWRFLGILAAITLVNYITGLILGELVSAKPRKTILIFSICFNLLTLVFFKYYDFFRLPASILLQKFGLKQETILLDIILPVGLSFYILRAISYNIDIYRNKIKPAGSLLDFALYIAFFPQLLSGPIARAGDFLPQLKNGDAKTIVNLQENLTLILMGLFKKIVISSYFTIAIIDQVFAVPQNHSSLAIIMAMYAYAIVIYVDFSGYSDMAVGIAGLLGFKSPENFNLPYLAQNIKDFWRRWHISLSSWLRDYLYIPLGGNRKGLKRKYLNLMATMLICGLWHGAGLNFIFWGGWHGIGVVANHKTADRKAIHLVNGLSELKYEKRYKMSRAGLLKKFIFWLFTFNFVCLGWIFFRAQNLTSGFQFLTALFRNFSLTETLPAFLLPALILGLGFVFFEKIIYNFLVAFQKILPLGLEAIFVAIVIIIIFKLGPALVPSFIYFSF